MARLYLALFFINMIMAIVALINCLSAEEDDVRALPRLVWAFVILFFPLVGSIAYFSVGKPILIGGVHAAGPSGHPADSGRASRTLAPDDDPEFLSRLDKQVAKDDAERLRRWEEDLHRRESDLRNRNLPRDGELRQRGAGPDDVSSTDS